MRTGTPHYAFILCIVRKERTKHVVPVFPVFPYGRQLLTWRLLLPCIVNYHPDLCPPGEGEAKMPFRQERDSQFVPDDGYKTIHRQTGPASCIIWGCDIPQIHTILTSSKVKGGAHTRSQFGQPWTRKRDSTLSTDHLTEQRNVNWKNVTPPKCIRKSKTQLFYDYW
jgi:hypothetical protein